MEEKPGTNETELIPPHVKSFLQAGYDDLESLWEKAALDSTDEIYWFKRWDKAYEWDCLTFRWFVGGLTNVCFSAVDYNVMKDRGGRAAIISEIAKTGETEVITYAHLLHLVKTYAAALRGMGSRRETGSPSTCPWE